MTEPFLTDSDRAAEPIAIIGMGCRFPEARDPREYWKRLSSGYNAIKDIPEDRWDKKQLFDSSPGRKGKIRSWKGAFLEDIKRFDWRALKLLPKEARYMDPQHRLLLELAWESLEDAGLLFDEISGGSTGVFIGIQWADYLRALVKKRSELDIYAVVGNCLMFAANRISYFFDFKGPSLALNSGCASSLVALKQACQSLWTGEIDMALVGAAELLISPEISIMIADSGIVSDKGRCLPLDSEADGFTRGEGAGMIVLKPVSKLQPEDRPYAYIRGVSLRHNGRNEWIMASNRKAQVESIREACRMAGAPPSYIDFVELHGTGNPKGDPIEVRSVAESISLDRAGKSPCFISSVKSSVGYLGPASGIAGLIKTVLSLYRKQIPPAHVPEKYNESIFMDEWNLKVPEKMTSWPEGDRETLACVTALSMGGAVAHAILSRADESERIDEASDVPLILPLSASDRTMMMAMVKKFICFLEEEQSEGRIGIGDVCYTAAMRRKHYKYRLAVIGKSYGDFINALKTLIDDYVGTGEVPPVIGGENIKADELKNIAASYANNEPRYFNELAGLYPESSRVSSLPTRCWNREYLWPKWLDAESVSSPDAVGEDSPAKACGSGGKSGDAVDMKALLKAPKEERENLIQAALRNMVSGCLGIDFAEGSVEGACFVDLGFNSLSAAELKSRLELDFQFFVPISFILEKSSINDLTAKMLDHFAENRFSFENRDDEAKSEHDFDEFFPLTDIQRAYWIGRADIGSFGGVGCHYYQEFESVGLDINRLELSFRRLILKHDMLRAAVTETGRQTILQKTPEFRIRRKDMRNLSGAELDFEIKSIREEMSTHVYSPEKWPLFSVSASILDKGRVRVHLSVDLLILDAHSLSLLIEDWGEAYRESREFNVELKYSFKDYVLSEINRKRKQAFSKSLEYWEKRAETLPPAPRLPLSPQYASGAKFHKRTRLTGGLDKGRWKCLITKARNMGLRPSSVLCMAFSEVLRTWSGDEKFSLNLTYCARTPYHPQVGELLGDFTSTILLEVDCAPETFRERARKLQDRLSEDMDHSIVSGVEAARFLRSKKGESEEAAMPIVFTSLLERREDLPSPFSPCWLGNPVYGTSQTPQVTIDLQAYEEDGSLFHNWDVVEGLFPPGVVESMLSAYNDLLRKLSERDFPWVDKRLSLTPKSQLELRLKLNSTARELKNDCLHGLFEKQSLKTPANIAASYGDKNIAYELLNSITERIACELLALGVKKNELVGVVMLKGWEQVAAVTGILKAGAAYLPVEADLPIARIDKILKSGESKVILTQSYVDSANQLPGNIKTLHVDKLAADKSEFFPSLPDTGAADLAYTIFTSGSTGAPKGVMINHSGAVNTILDINSRFKVNRRDKILALSSLGFDLSVYDIFGALAVGAEIVLPEYDGLRNPGHWIRLINEKQVTIWNSAPALMTMTTDYFSEDRHEALDSLRLVLLSGDWIPPSLPEKIRKIAPYSEIISLGGATEASIWSILYPIEENNFSARAIPYGKPMKNQSFHVLDKRLLPAPNYTAGELFIGGEGLAMGYWKNQPETDYRFIVHPLTGERLYRTGDLGRYAEDGNIEILGRVDFQIKIRGHRVEPGEIEAAIVERDDIKDATLIAKKTPGVSLAAYVVSLDDAITEDELKFYLEERLPGHMIPAEIFFIDKIPATANGKVDRAKLLKIAKPKKNNKPRKKLGETERIIADIIKEELKQDFVDIDDNLFSLGASSIELVPIHKKIVSRLKVEMNIAELFNHATVRSLSRKLERLKLGKHSNVEKSQSVREQKISGRHKIAARGKKRRRSLKNHF